MNAAFKNSLTLEKDSLDLLVANPSELERYLDPAELQAVYDRFPGQADTLDIRALFRALSVSHSTASKAVIAIVQTVLRYRRLADSISRTNAILTTPSIGGPNGIAVIYHRLHVNHLY